MKQETIQNKESLNNQDFFEFDDDGSAYKACITCGQSQYPFKHGMCRICGANNFIVNYEVRIVQKVQKLGIRELLDN